jgi:hypothetical protein
MPPNRSAIEYSLSENDNLKLVSYQLGITSSSCSRVAGSISIVAVEPFSTDILRLLECKRLLIAGVHDKNDYKTAAW